jgi:hypothetical protein
MPLRSGMNSSLGFAAESTYGTYQAPARWVPHVSAPLDHQIDRLESEGIMAGRRVLDSDQWAPGDITAGVPLGLELYDRSIGLLFTHMFGSVVTTGVGPFTHTFTPGDLSGKSLTMQIGTPNSVDGTVHPFSLLGCKIASWELGLSAGEIATLGLDVLAKDVTTAQALVAPAYSAGIGIGMTFVGAAVTIAGSPYKTKEITLAGDNGLADDRRFIGQQTIDEPLEAALREYTGTIDSELFDLTAYNRFVNGTAAALVFSLARGTATATFTMNIQFDGDPPQVEGREIVMESLPFKCIGDTDAAAITCVLVNGDSTP